MLFSATLDGEVGELARAYTSNPVRVEARLPESEEQGEVVHTFVAVTVDGKLDRLIEELESTVSWRSFSSAPSAAPIGSPASCTRVTCLHWRCTAT